MKPFDIFKKMNEDDAKNGTRNLGVFTECLGGQTVRGGEAIKMGCHTGAICEIARDEVMPVLLWVNKKEYARLQLEPQPPKK